MLNRLHCIELLPLVLRSCHGINNPDFQPPNKKDGDPKKRELRKKIKNKKKKIKREKQKKKKKSGRRIEWIEENMGLSWQIFFLIFFKGNKKY